MRRIRLPLILFRALRRDGQIKARIWTSEDFKAAEYELVLVYSYLSDTNSLCDCILLAKCSDFKNVSTQASTGLCWECKIVLQREIFDL